MRIQRLGRDEVDAWLDLWAAVAQERLWIAAEPPVNRERRREWLLEHIESPEACLLAASVDDVLAGSAGVELRGGLASLGMLVAASHRGRGIGTALLVAALEWAREAGAHKMTLQVWPHNTAARHLYRRAGFVEEGRMRRHYRRNDGSLWDAIIMGLVLDEDSPGGPLDPAN